MPSAQPDIETGIDAEGRPYARAHGMTYRLTPCCFASLKGTDGGVGCRGCYTLDVPGWVHDAPVEPLTPAAGDRLLALYLASQSAVQ